MNRTSSKHLKRSKLNRYKLQRTGECNYTLWDQNGNLMRILMKWDVGVDGQIGAVELKQRKIISPYTTFASRPFDDVSLSSKHQGSSFVGHD